MHPDRDPFAERDLLEALPEYADYRRRVPMTVPRVAPSRRVGNAVG